MQPVYAKNETRSIKPEILVAVGICTHLGLPPSSDKFKTGAESGVSDDWPGGFCARVTAPPSTWQAGVHKSKPAPDNQIPPHAYLATPRS